MMMEENRQSAMDFDKGSDASLQRERSMAEETTSTRQRRATRRQVLQTSGAAAAAFLATNAVADAAPATNGYRAAPLRVSNDSISFLMRSDAKSAYAADAAADAWGKVYGAK